MTFAPESNSFLYGIQQPCKMFKTKESKMDDRDTLSSKLVSSVSWMEVFRCLPI